MPPKKRNREVNRENDDDDDDEVTTATTAPRQHKYVLLHKPRGVITSTKRDPSCPSRGTVLELVKEEAEDGSDGLLLLAPVGRLDAESEGLLLLTTDGHLAQRLLHPRYAVRKRYLAVARTGGCKPGTARKRLTKEICDDAVANGVNIKLQGAASAYDARPVAMRPLSFVEADAELGGGRALARCVAEFLPPEKMENNEEETAAAAAAAEAAALDFVAVDLCEGKFHEVRRLLRALGFHTLRLVRVRQGPLSDPGLLAAAPGSHRMLTAAEVAAMRNELELV